MEEDSEDSEIHKCQDLARSLFKFLQNKRKHTDARVFFHLDVVSATPVWAAAVAFISSIKINA